MSQKLSPLWTHLTSEGRLTGTWRSALPYYQNQSSPCLGACPVNGRIAEWIKHVKDGAYRDGWITLTENNPFPAIAGRICHHPCETSCNRQELDETVGICSLERFVGDTALTHDWQFPAAESQTSLSVAIIGGGPAGLSAAYQLRRRGIQVSLYESKSQLGGLMRYGIPSYRLNRDVLDGEVERIVAMGIDLHLNSEVFDEIALTELHDNHDAVFLATGASLPKPLPNLDYDQPWVIDSAAFLAASTADQAHRTGTNVIVVGGGSAAMDVARSARRLGREVTVLTLEQDGKLPAQQIEIVEAKEEGISFVHGAMLLSAEREGAEVTVLCQRVTDKPDRTPGSLGFVQVAGSEFELSTNTIIPAIGQDADIDRWGSLIAARGSVADVSERWQTETQGLYAAGDFASTSRFVTQAVGMGKEVALAIAAQLMPGTSPSTACGIIETGYERINIAYQDTHGRLTQRNLDITTRLNSFSEVQQPLSQSDAQSEAARCFSCGTCITCDNCYFYCPDMAISKVDGGYRVDPDFCKGCGLCVAECPTGSIHMQEDTAL